MDRCTDRSGCRQEAVIRIRYDSKQKPGLFCQRHADAKCMQAESKGVFLTQEALSGYDPDADKGYY